MKTVNLPNIAMKGLEIYYPEYSCSVDETIEKYEEQGIDVEYEVKELFGKETVHKIKDNVENSLTMALKAVNKVLSSTNLKGSDIDMIVMASSTPEYFTPPTSKIILDEIQGPSHAVAYDINMSCSALVFSLIQVSNQMQLDESLNTVLLVGSDCVSRHIRSGQPIYESIVGDMSCAIILQKTEEDAGVIDQLFFSTFTPDEKRAHFPYCGLSNIYTATPEDRKCQFSAQPLDTQLVAEKFQTLLNRNQLTIDDISAFCCTQLASYHLKAVSKHLSIPDDKMIYVANQYGYPGVACNFLALHHALQEGKVKRGDYVFLWGLGSGFQMVFCIIKY